MTSAEITNMYFDWLYDLACSERFGESTSYRSLLLRLYEIEFIPVLEKDENRAEDGINMRYRFEFYTNKHVRPYLSKPCSILEMMLALCVRCEEDIMDDGELGDRTSQWFWNMIINLGLGSMDDARYNRKHVDDVIDKFIYREYERDGRGGLFTIKNCRADLRDVEIWYQMNWYISSIT